MDAHRGEVVTQPVRPSIVAVWLLGIASASMAADETSDAEHAVVGSAPCETVVDRAEDALRASQHGDAYRMLKDVVESTPVESECYSRAYLAFIKTHFMYAGRYRSGEDPDVETAFQWLEDGQELVRRGLERWELRRLRPAENGQAPPEMVEYFIDQAPRFQGELRLSPITPIPSRIALVAVDELGSPSDTLLTFEGDSTVVVDMLPRGEYIVRASADGHVPYEETVLIGRSLQTMAVELDEVPGAVKRAVQDPYVQLAAVVVLSYAAAVVLSGDDGTSSPADDPLPGPPPPPGR